MKQKIQYFSLLFMIMITIISCREDLSAGPTIPACNWTSEADISVQNIALKAPSGMSSFYYGQLPSDRIFRTLTHPLWKGNFNSSKNLAKIQGNLKPDQKDCTGPQQPFSFKEGSSKIGGNYLRLPAPSNATFFGIVTMIIRSDDYKTASDPNNAEYVLWTGTGSDPDFPAVNGNILGSRKTYRPSSGKISDSGKGGGCYYLSGRRICP